VSKQKLLIALHSTYMSTHGRYYKYMIQIAYYSYYSFVSNY